jgi:hypothetical protein
MWGMVIYMGYGILLGVRQFVGEYETLFAVRYFIWGTTIYMGGNAIYMGVCQSVWGLDSLYGI